MTRAPEGVGGGSGGRAGAPASAAQAVVQALLENDVEHVFGIPGTHNLPFYAALAASPIEHVVTRQEAGAGYAADGYARTSGRPGVCLVTTGPGLTNVLTAAATAYADSIPLLVLSPGMATDVEGRDTGFLHETKDQGGAADRLLAWSHRASSPADAWRAVQEAFASFRSGRPRPVHVELPLDVLERAEPLGAPAVPEPPLPEPAASELAAAVELLAAAARPALVLGGGARGAQAEATALAELLGAGVVTTVNGKGTVSERHALSLGAAIRLPSARGYLESRDVVLAVGTELGESDLWGAPLRLAGRVVRVDLDAGQLEKNAAATVRLHGDARAVLAALLERLGGVRDKPADARLDAHREAIAREALRDGAPFAPLMRALRARLAPDAILCADSTMPAYYGAVHFFDVEAPGLFAYPTGYATLGYALPAAIGAKLAHPERAVVGLIGDGGLMFTLAELLTAAELRQALPIVVSNNDGYGEIKAEMIERSIPPIGVDLLTPDFVALGEALRCHATRCEHPDAVADAVADALTADRPTLIEWPS